MNQQFDDRNRKRSIIIKFFVEECQCCKHYFKNHSGHSLFYCSISKQFDDRRRRGISIDSYKRFYEHFKKYFKDEERKDYTCKDFVLSELFYQCTCGKRFKPRSDGWYIYKNDNGVFSCTSCHAPLPDHIGEEYFEHLNERRARHRARFS